MLAIHPVLWIAFGGFVIPAALVGGGMYAIYRLIKSREKIGRLEGVSDLYIEISGPRPAGPYVINVVRDSTKELLHSEPWDGEIKDGWEHAQTMFDDFKPQPLPGG
jgi:hypothetical protein